MKYIDSEKLIAEIERQQRNLIVLSNTEQEDIRRVCAIQNGVYTYILDLITSLQQEQTEVDLKKLKNKAELIANEIMMGVQGNKYHTCIYDKASNDFNHSHLFRAALKGIEIGLNARKL